MSRILIIGGTGFISSCLAKYLFERGNQVTIFTRGKSRPASGKIQGVEHIVGNRRDPGDLARALNGKSFDAVYDMVAYHPEDSKMAAELFRGNVGRFIHCSTVSVYMVSHETQCPIAEDQDHGPVMDFWDRNPFGMEYGVLKRQCEHVLWRMHDQKEFPVSILRPTFVSGPHDPAIRDWFWIERILDGQPLLVPGSGDVAFQQVYIDDVARAFADVLEHDTTKGKVYNVAAEEIFSLNDYLNALGDMLGKHPDIVHMEQDVFQGLPLSSHPRGDVFPFNVQRTSIFNLDRIKQDLHYHSTPFSEWMSKTIDWYRKEFGQHSLGYEKRDQELQAISRWKTAGSLSRREFAHEA